jgi:DNA-binding NarL/FixJ family response regulator
VAVVDLALPDGDGRELIGELRRSRPGVRIMVLSATVWAEDVEEVLRAGADTVHDKVRSYSTIGEEVNAWPAGERPSNTRNAGPNFEG